jgi:hypothetical protein
MTDQATLISRDELDNGEPLNDWEWETEFKAMAWGRIERLKTAKLSRVELYQELIQLMLELEVYWCGQSLERQRDTARDVRELLRECEAQKEKMQSWARHQIAQRAPEFKAALDFRDRMKEFEKDFRRRHPKRGELF